MALIKPILNTVNSFDAHVGFEFTFQVVGGDKVTGCRLSIFNNSTNTLMYRGIQTHDSYNFILPADATYLTYTIINKTSGAGGNYNAYVETTADTGTLSDSSTWSEPSSRIQFYCFVTPTFEFTVDTTTVNTATNTWYINYTTNSTYPTEDIDGLATYGFTLYNSDGSQAKTSGTLYTASRPDLNYTFSGLLDGNEYKVQAFGVTNNQMHISTALDTFNVSYELPTPTGIISATNVCSGGYIIVQVDISDISNLNDYEYARIYRKDANVASEDWLLLIENYVTSISSGVYVYNDRYNRYGVTYSYAIVLVDFSGIETSYTTVDEYSEFDGIFLSDLNLTYKIYAGAQYGDTTSVQKVGVHETIGGKYPILVYNSETDYKKGSVTCSVLDQNYDENRVINRFGVTQKVNTLDAFLKNKSAKILKDWNGNIWLCSIVGEPSVSYNNNFGMGYIDCNFEWVEQGRYDNYDDLLKNRLISLISPVSIKFIGLYGTVINLSNSSGDVLNATIGSTGEIIITTYTVGAYSGTITLTNSFGTQTQNIGITIQGGVLNIIDVSGYNLTISGNSSVYTASPSIYLENNGNVLTCTLSQETVIPIIQTGTWNGYAMAYSGQKQSISAVISDDDDTITVYPASTLTISTSNDVSYLLSNINGSFTNTISGAGDGIYNLFSNGIWSGNSYSAGNQIMSESVDITNYGSDYELSIEYTTVTFSATARIASSIPMTISNSGSTISKTFSATNGGWNTKLLQIGNRNPSDVAYGNGYYVMCSNTNSISYSTSLSGTWTSKTLGLSINSVAYGNGYWVVVDNNNNGIWYCASVPTGTWTFKSVASSGYGLYDIAYNNGYWVAMIGCEDESVPTTDNGIWYCASVPTGTWKFKNMISSGHLSSIHYQNGYWIVLDIDRESIWYRASTPNGTWTQKYITIDGITQTYPMDISYGNGYWAIIDNVNNSIYYTSSDLNSTWSAYTYIDETYIPFNSLNSIKYISGYWIISYSTGSTQSATCGILYRYDNINPENGFADFIKEGLVSTRGKLFYVNNNMILQGGTVTGQTARVYYYHTFPSTLPDAQTQTYSIIKSGIWSGSASIDNYTKILSTTIPNPPSGSVTLDIKDKALT